MFVERKLDFSFNILIFEYCITKRESEEEVKIPLFENSLSLFATFFQIFCNIFLLQISYIKIIRI